MVRRHRADDSIARALAKIVRSDLTTVDGIGLLPVSEDAAEGFYRLVDAACERRSIAVSSNLHPSGFDEIMPKTPVTATVDRLLHHAHVTVTQGDSFRFTEATTGMGAKPFSQPAPSQRGEIPGRHRGTSNGRQRGEPPLAPSGENDGSSALSVNSVILGSPWRWGTMRLSC